MREPPDPLSFFRALEAEPWRYDFFHALRRIECLFPRLPRLGTATRLAEEPLRLGQDPALTFAPAALAAFRTMPGASVPTMQVRFLGLLGPNGPLPLHLAEFARARALHANDPTLLRFFDLVNHRFLLLFYRAWAQAQPTVSLDRPREDRFAIYTGALFGLGETALRGRDALDDAARLFNAGLLARQVRNREGLQSLLSGFFRMPVEVDDYVGHWMTLTPADRTRVGRCSTQLGQGALLGARVWDRQHKFRIRIGPLDLDWYHRFLPAGRALAELAAWVRQYLGFELDWEVRLLLVAAQVPACAPGRYGRLGWTTWLGKQPRAGPAADLTLDPERLSA